MKIVRSEKKQNVLTTEHILAIIESLQQEMELPEKYQTPDWLFEEQEQPEVDLEKEILDWIGDEDSCKNGKWTWDECNKMLRHFYELGLKARIRR